MGQLYAALYLSQKPIPLDELAKTCRMSKGNASINIRRLERWGGARKVWGTENRKDYYEPNRDIIGFAVKHGFDLVSQLLNEGQGVVADAHAKMNTVNAASLS